MTSATSWGTGVGSPSATRIASMPRRAARYVVMVAMSPPRPSRYMANAPTARTMTNAMLRGFVALPTIQTPAVPRSASTICAGTSWSASAWPRFRSSHQTPADVTTRNVKATAARGTMQRASRALGGGFLVAFGLWWVYYVREAVERCDAFNRQPNGSCAIYGAPEQLALAGCVVLLGTLLVVIALRQETARAA